jgi:hypothetical protein
MTADRAWCDRARAWAAPVPAWVWIARGREGEAVGDGPVRLLAYLWSLADAPSKRGRGHVTLDVADEQRRPPILQRQLSDHLDKGIATIKTWERALRASGLLARPSDGVLVLADVAPCDDPRATTGYLPEAAARIITGGVETRAPDSREVSDPDPCSGVEGQDPDPRRVQFRDLEGFNSETSKGSIPDPPIRKPDLPDLPDLPDPSVAKNSGGRDPLRVLANHPHTHQAAMASRWVSELEECMRDGLTPTDVMRIVEAHERATADAKLSGTLAQLQADSAGKGPELGLPALSRLWGAWSKCVQWRAQALGQGSASRPAPTRVDNFAGSTSATSDRLQLELSRRKRGEKR